MKSETDFAVLYKALVDRHMNPNPQRLEALRNLLMDQLSIPAPPERKQGQSNQQT